MVTYTKTLREFSSDSKQYSNSDVAIAIALSLFFLVVVALAHRALGNVDPEIVFVALVPLLIVLLISGNDVNWGTLASDINDGSVLDYPGTVSEDISIPAHSSSKSALLAMKEHDRNWLPVLSGGRLFGVVSEDQLLRDVILTWMEEGPESAPTPGETEATTT